MRIDLREVELSSNEEDHRTNGRESTIAAGLALRCLEEPIQGLQEAVGSAGLRPGADALDMGAHETGDYLHGLDLGAADVGTPLLEHRAHDVDLFAVQNLTQLLPVHPGPGGAFGRHLSHQGVEFLTRGGVQA